MNEYNEHKRPHPTDRERQAPIKTNCVCKITVHRLLQYLMTENEEMNAQQKYKSFSCQTNLTLDFQFGQHTTEVTSELHVVSS